LVLDGSPAGVAQRITVRQAADRAGDRLLACLDRVRFAAGVFGFQEPPRRADLHAQEAIVSASLISTLVLIYAGLSLLGVAAGVSILRKAGYSPWWVITGFIPLVNVVMVVAFAFADWPVLQQRRRDQRHSGADHPEHRQPAAAQITGDPRFTYSYSPSGPGSHSPAGPGS
jgi:hypothetical protein